MLDYLFSFRTFQQFIALYRKNALVAWRNRRATILRIFAPLFFLLLALLIDRALQADDSQDSAFKDVKSPTVEFITAIPRCNEDMYIGSDRDCIDVLYSPNGTVPSAIMAEVVARNSNPIKAQGFATQLEIQQFLLANPDTVTGAVHFIFENPPFNTSLAGFLLQTNTTLKYFKGEFQDPNTFMQLPLQSAVQREIARYYMKQDPALATEAESLSWSTGLKVFAHPTIATTSVLGQVLGPFIFAACMFSFVTQIGAVVQEKELGLRQAMRTMGLTDTAYWASWMVWEVTLAFFIAHAICIFGLILQFKLFLENNYGLLFFLFFLFLLAMSSFAMMLSTFIGKTQVAVYLGFCIFIVGWIMQTVVIFGVPYTPDYYYSAGGFITGIFTIFPWNTLVKGFNDLAAATIGNDSPGLDWNERDSYCQNIANVGEQPSYNPRELYKNFECVMSLQDIYYSYIILWIIYFVLAVYLDNIIPNEHGVSKPFYYFLLPSYWLHPRSPGLSSLRSTVSGRTKRSPPEEAVTVDDDVQQEGAKMRDLLDHRTGKGGALAGEGPGPRNAVEVYGLQKLYAGKKGFCGLSVKCCGCCSCCSCEVTQDFWAIKGSWFAIEENTLFCLLGPNGAGKTTTINCLTGAQPPTNGDALVYGEAITSAGGMERIRAKMGVCPQFDVLWNELTGREHLCIYGSIKGIPWRKVGREADDLLEKVKLTAAASQRSGAYSGGMKRRLSVAIALLGDPKIVYLDEPTTGMDPISRRYVWDIIQEAKVGRAIVLTTHSMEEADILGDRVAIMARGRLRAIGTSLRLKQKFGAGYQISVSVVSGHVSTVDLQAIQQRTDNVKAYFRQHLGIVPQDESKAYMQFLVERSREPELVDFLARLQQDKESLAITDVQISLTSLEEVFLTIARNAEMELAASTGQADVKYTTDDGVQLTIPLGAEMLFHRPTNQYYKVRWATDEAGSLSVADAQPCEPPPPSAYITGPDGMPGSIPVAMPAGKAGFQAPGHYPVNGVGGNRDGMPVYESTLPGYYPSMSSPTNQQN